MIAPWGREQNGLGFIATAATVGGGALVGGVAGASWAAIAIPIVGPAIVGITLGVAAMVKRNQTNKIRASQVVDEIEPYMASNRDAYFAGPRNRSSQAQALANFDAMWADVVRACSDPSLGGPGQRCIAERQPGGQWDWFSYYRDPIAGDAAVADPLVTDPFSGVMGPVTNSIAASPYRDILPLAGAALLLVGVLSLRGAR